MFRYFILFCILLVVPAAGCQIAPTPSPTPEPTSVPTEPPSAQESNNFVIWGLSGLGDKVNEQLIAIFKERHPDINVVILDQGWDEALRQNLENAIQMGRPPDVVIGENYFRYFAARGDMLPLNDLIEAHQDDIIPATYAAAVYQDNIYAVPYLTGIFALERNCKVIDSAGLDCDTPPTTWDELLDEAQRINERGAGIYYGYTLQGPGGTAVGAAFRIAVYQAQLDALPCADDACTIPDFDKPEMTPVFEFLRELVQYTPPGLLSNTNEGQVYEALFRGVSAYQMAGSWHPAWAMTAGCTTCRYSALPVPDGGHAANLLVGNVLFGVPSASQHPDLAKEWLSLMLSDEFQEMAYTTIARLPVRRSILTKLQPEADEATRVFIGELLANADLQILPQWETAPKETWAIYNQLLTGVLTTNRSFAELMTEAQQKVEALD